MIPQDKINKKETQNLADDDNDIVNAAAELQTIFGKLPPQFRTKILRIARMLMIEAEIAESGKR